MTNIDIKLNGNIQVNIDNNETFDRNLLIPLPLLDEIEKKILSILHKGGESVKGSESFTSEWRRGEDIIGKVEVNYERI